MADLQSAALATWLQPQSRHGKYRVPCNLGNLYRLVKWERFRPTFLEAAQLVSALRGVGIERKTAGRPHAASGS